MKVFFGFVLLAVLSCALAIDFSDKEADLMELIVLASCPRYSLHVGAPVPEPLPECTEKVVDLVLRIRGKNVPFEDVAESVSACERDNRGDAIFNCIQNRLQ